VKLLSRFAAPLGFALCVFGWIYMITLAEGAEGRDERLTNSLIFIACQFFALILAIIGFFHINRQADGTKKGTWFALWGLLIAISLMGLFMGANLIFLDLYGI